LAQDLFRCKKTKDCLFSLCVSLRYSFSLFQNQCNTKEIGKNTFMCSFKPC